MTTETREIGYGTLEYEETVRLRRTVLRTPLGLDFSAADLANEKSLYHFAAFREGLLVGCMILVPVSRSELKMRQVATAPDARGQGVGTSLVRFAEAFARREGFTEMKLSARETAVSFYLGLGYSVVGESYVEVTVPHRLMVKRISA